MAVDTVDPAEWSIFDATDACRRSFEDCLTITSLTDQEWAENRLADFNLWTAGVGASVKSRASLDERLAFEPEVRALVVNLLTTLKAFVEQCKELGSHDATSTIGHAEKHSGVASVDGKPVSRPSSQVSSASSSDSGSEAISGSGPPLTETIKSTEVILDQLTRLAVAIRKSGTASRLLKADLSLDPKDHKDLRDHLALILLARPSDIEDRRHTYWDASRPDKWVNLGVDVTQLNTVQLRLVDANIRRRNRFVYAQHHARKLGGSQIWSMPKRVESHDFNTVKHVTQQKETVLNQKQDNAELGKLKITQDTLATTDTTASAVGTAIAISENQIPTLIDICSQIALPIIACCPLCDVANEQGGVLDQNSLLDHVAKHIHEFSLRSLPWAAAADEVDKSHFYHSVGKVKDWFTT
ncbi:hypothetical protein BDZ45DRAFT_578657, partial [Acephala macrosclerotiorum]